MFGWRRLAGVVVGRMPSNVEGFDNLREPVLSPAMPERDGERDDLRPTAPRDAIEIANELRKEVVRVEFPDDQLQECTRPRERRRPRCEYTQRSRTKLLPPPLGIELLLCSSGVFEESIDVEGEIVDLAHAQTSVIATRALVLACRNAGGLGRPRLRCG
jgi:hypothetical protein